MLAIRRKAKYYARYRFEDSFSLTTGKPERVRIDLTQVHAAILPYQGERHRVGQEEGRYDENMLIMFSFTEITNDQRIVFENQPYEIKSFEKRVGFWRAIISLVNDG